MDNNTNQPVLEDEKYDPETLAGYRDAECEKCMFASTCPDANGIPGPCDAFIDKEDDW